MLSEPKYTGEFEGIFRGVAIGWVVNMADPNIKVVIEVLCDGYAIAIDRAEIARTDIAETLKAASGTDRDCTFGYEIAVPVHALNAGASVSIRVANTDVVFAPTEKPRAKSKKQRVAGEVHANGGLLLTGWVYPREYRVSPVTLTIEEDGEVIASFVADDPVSHQGHGSLPALIRGFRHRLPMRLADGNVHILRVYDDTRTELKGSPVSVAAWTSGTADLARIVEEDLPEGSKAAEVMQSLRIGFEKSAQYSNASVPFSDYSEWAKLFGPTPTGQTPREFFTVVLYGEDDQDVSLDSLIPQQDWVQSTIRFEDLDGMDASRLTNPVVFLRDGDRLDPVALEHAALALDTHKLVYSDSDQEVNGAVLPWFKPDWDRFLFASQGYAVGMLAGYVPTDMCSNAKTVEALMIEMVTSAKGDIGHIDHILYHQKSANAHGEAPICHEAFREAVNASSFAEVFKGKVQGSAKVNWINRFAWDEDQPLPKVSIIIPTKDKVDLLKVAVSSLMEITSYPDYEILVVDNNSIDSETHEYLVDVEKKGVRVLPYPGAFNFSAINNVAVKECDGDMICLLNNDVEIFSQDWLTELVRIVLVDGVGAAGAKLLWKNDMVQHGGVILGIDGGAIHIGNRWARDDMGYAGMNHTMRKSSCVTAACLVLRKADYEALGGMKHVEFPVTFNDVDLCLRLGEKRKEIVWSPQAELFHVESASRGTDELAEKTARAHRELSNLRSAWGKALLADPSYNRNLNRDRAPYEGLAMPPFKKAGTAA